MLLTLLLSSFALLTNNGVVSTFNFETSPIFCNSVLKVSYVDSSGQHIASAIINQNDFIYFSGSGSYSGSTLRYSFDKCYFTRELSYISYDYDEDYRDIPDLTLSAMSETFDDFNQNMFVFDEFVPEQDFSYGIYIDDFVPPDEVITLNVIQNDTTYSEFNFYTDIYPEHWILPNIEGSSIVGYEFKVRDGNGITFNVEDLNIGLRNILNDKYGLGYSSGVQAVINNPSEFDLWSNNDYVLNGSLNYQQGYTAGLSDSNDLNFYTFLRTLLHAPVDMFSGALNFSLPLGNGSSLDILPLMTFMLTISIALAVVKLIIGGK